MRPTAVEGQLFGANLPFRYRIGAPAAGHELALVNGRFQAANSRRERQLGRADQVATGLTDWRRTRRKCPATNPVPIN